jgi:alpha-L-rhamnosidase
VHVLYRDVLGLHQVDTVTKAVQLRFTDSRLDWAEGSLPTPDGPVELRWRKDNTTLLYQVSAPAGYRIQVNNLSRLQAVPQH